MKKIILILLCLSFLVGCTTSNTPRKKTEEFFDKYKNLNEEVIKDLDRSLNEMSVDEELAKETKELYKRQYKDMKVKILDEKIKGKKATVKAKITVYNYAKIKDDAANYMDTHNEEFMNDNVLDDVKFEKYILQKQKETKETVNYDVKIKLEKENGKWKVQELNDETIGKMRGTYSDNE